MNMIEVKVPDIGDFKDVEVIEVLVKPGDMVTVDQSLITVESDKASMEIPSSHAGIVKEMKAKLGDKVSEGSLVLLLDSDASAAEPVAAPVATPATTPVTTSIAAPVVIAVPAPVQTAPAPSAPVPPPAAGKAHASPSVRKYARELGVDLSLVDGSGAKGRITHEDVQSFVKGVMSGANVLASSAAAVPASSSGSGLNLLPWPSLDFSKFGPTELLPLSRIKKMSGPNLHRNWVMIPHVTQYEQTDVTDLEAFRVASNDSLKKDGVRLTMLAFVIKAVVTVLKRYPDFNASLDESGDNLIIKNYWNIGFAADTVHGLVVPVVKDADKKGVVEIAQEMGDLSKLAREGKLGPSDMQGASFTITSLGGIGGTYFTPLINAPEVAILGLSRLSMQPVWNGKEFVPRLILPLSLSYDHRVIDGAQGTRFTTYLAEVLADMRKIIL
ncbi:MAG: dihydrolipoamide acetyltransferase [Burkholderiaceae bacterium]|nr:dihydrolipoamide acetyltransferase [Burkholderiaceae bacterium]